MTTTRATFGPLAAEFPAATFPQLQPINRRPALSYDAGTDETAYWAGIAPQGLTGTMTAVITYSMASATTGDVKFQVAVEAISDGDSVDMDAADSFDTTNSPSAVTVPATAGFPDQLSVTLTNQDSIAAGDYFRISVTRDANDAGDTATGDCHVYAVELRDAA